MKKWLPVSFWFLLTACGGGDSEQAGKTVFRYNQAAGITSLDPAYCRNTENIWAVNQLFNGLVQMDKNLKVQPCIAKSWEIDSTGTTYTFHLRTDVYFHDSPVFPEGKGRKISAHDFAYSFKRITDPDIASPGAWIFNYVVKSEEEYYLGFNAVNDSTFQIFLREPFPPFLGILTMQYCSVVPEEASEEYGEDFRMNPVGTGPFMFKNWKEGAKLVLVKNPNYFEFDEDKRLPYLDAVSISFVKERQVAFLDFLQGKYDFVSSLEAMASYKDEVLDPGGELQAKYKEQIVMEKQPYLKTDYLGILIDPDNDLVKKSPLKVKAIRQAINYGFDRGKMIRHLRNNIGVPATKGFVAMGLPYYDRQQIEGYNYNPERAKELLLLAGFPDGQGLPLIHLVSTSEYKDECEFIQHELGEIGIKVDLEVIDAAAYREMVALSKVNMFRKSWIADYPDAENFLSLFYSDNFSPQGPNYTHFNNPDFDKLYEEAVWETDEAERLELYKMMDQMVIEEAPVVPLYYAEIVRFVQKNIDGLETNPMNLLTLKRVKKAKADK